MLRPATPLTILFFLAFVLLLLATISTPIVKAIPLAEVRGVKFGVFGYCTATECTPIQVGYSVDGKTLFNDADQSSDFSLPTGARSSLPSILIVHPIAALLTLICFLMSAAAHLHAPSHSPRYLIGLLILSIPTFLCTLLAFLVDILLFVPHLSWGGWIVLASTILILASGIVTCAMRRTLVSRKDQKRRIAENAEMNGENFYANQAPVPQGLRADSPPPLVSGPTGQSDKLPSFATFEKKAPEEDQIPLNSRSPSNRTLPRAPSSRGQDMSDNGSERYGPPPRGAPGGMRGGRGGRGGFGPRDEYGNPLPASNAFGPAPPMGMRRDRSEPPMRRQYSDDDAMVGHGPRGGRGRGGYPPRGYGRGGPSGRGRGGYGRGGLGPSPNGGPPPGYGNGNGYFPQQRPGQYEGPGPAMAAYGRSPSAPGYGRRQYPDGPPSEGGGAYYGRRSPGPPSAPGGYNRGPSPGPPSAPGGYNRGPSPGPPSMPGGYNRGPSPGPPSMPGGYNRGPSPGPPSMPGGYNRGPSRGPPDSGRSTYDRQDAYQDPLDQAYRRPSPPSPPLMTHAIEPGMIGQAVEMDARHGSPSMSPAPQGPNQQLLRDSDTDVQGFVGLQQPPKHRDSPMSMSSVYSANETYVPPRATWKGTQAGRGPEIPSNNIALNNVPAASTPDPVELPVQSTHRKPRSNTGGSSRTITHNRKPSESYYEDVDPRFAAPEPLPHHQPDFRNGTQTQATSSSAAMPSALMPGITRTPPPHLALEQNGEIIDPTSSYDDLPDGQRSPASDHSGMTSISQRGVNPNWQPGNGNTQLGVPNRRPAHPLQQQQQQERDTVLDSNLDFGLPQGRARGASGGRGGLPPVHVPPPTQHGQAF